MQYAHDINALQICTFQRNIICKARWQYIILQSSATCLVTTWCKLNQECLKSVSTPNTFFEDEFSRLSICIDAKDQTPQSNKQVYLLTPMDRATLLHAKSTITHCRPSIITRQRASVDSKLLHSPRNVAYYHIFERAGIPPWYETKPTRSTQPCISLGC